MTDETASVQGEGRCAADENFKATFGHYPIPADLPEPSGDPADAALAMACLRRGRPLEKRDMRVIDGTANVLQTPFGSRPDDD